MSCSLCAQRWAAAASARRRSGADAGGAGRSARVRAQREPDGKVLADAATEAVRDLRSRQAAEEEALREKARRTAALARLQAVNAQTTQQDAVAMAEAAAREPAGTRRYEWAQRAAAAAALDAEEQQQYAAALREEVARVERDIAAAVAAGLPREEDA